MSCNFCCNEQIKAAVYNMQQVGHTPQFRKAHDHIMQHPLKYTAEVLCIGKGVEHQ